MSILVIYTGGTIGATKNSDGLYEPTEKLENIINLVLSKHIISSLPKHDLITLEPSIDSSCIKMNDYNRIADLIISKKDDYKGFVVLHGTDTMAHTTSMLSFLLMGLNKPVIVTGSQIPLVDSNTDAINNLSGALFCADNSSIFEVCLYFNNKLFRGNRVTKFSSIKMNAFESPNYPYLKEFDCCSNNTDYDSKVFKNNKLEPSPRLDTIDNVNILYLAPGLCEASFSSVLKNDKLKALIIMTFGSGNVPTSDSFIAFLNEAKSKNISMLNIIQCMNGYATESYAASAPLYEAGVISGYDMTLEAAYTKAHYLIAKYNDSKIFKEKINQDLAGEITIP